MKARGLRQPAQMSRGHVLPRSRVGQRLEHQPSRVSAHTSRAKSHPIKMPSRNITNITLGTFNSVLSRYAPAVPAKLHELDALRYDTIPSSVADLKGEITLSKDQVEKLVEWKL
jgi:hypothetical protein